MEANRCPRCGHNYYEGGSGLCKWCKEEESVRCHICGAQAQCSSSGGYACYECAPIAQERDDQKRKDKEQQEEDDAWKRRCEWEEEHGPIYDDDY